jgi:hypothetical protein
MVERRIKNYTSLEQFVSGRIVIDENQCWNWQPRGGANGYRSTSFNGKHRLVHRVSAFFCLGLDLDDASQIVDHKCRNRMCCNPDHLRIVTQEENIHAPGSLCVAKARAEKQCCPKCGGQYTLRYPAWLKGKGVRRCDPCDNEYKRTWERSRRANGVAA